MNQVTIEVPDNKYSFFLELINNLGFVSHTRKTRVAEKENPVLQSLKQGLKEVEMAKSGKLKTKSLKDFLNEV